jgi:hypothetical protein
MTGLATFPCNDAKEPISPRGFKDAVRGVSWRKAPLVGAPTGAANGFDVLDVDGEAGRGWYDRNFDAIPTTRAHSTERGMHLLFRCAEGLRCSTGRIAPGVDVRAEGGYVIWWPREGLPVEDAPICEWPDWLLAEAMAGRSLTEYPSTNNPSLPHAVPPLPPVRWPRYGTHCSIQSSGVGSSLRDAKRATTSGLR